MRLHDSSHPNSPTYVSVPESIFRNKCRKRILKTSLYASQRVRHVHMCIVWVNIILLELWCVEVGTSAFCSFLEKVIARRTIRTRLVQSKTIAYTFTNYVLIRKTSINALIIPHTLLSTDRLFFNLILDCTGS